MREKQTARTQMTPMTLTTQTTVETGHALSLQSATVMAILLAALILLTCGGNNGNGDIEVSAIITDISRKDFDYAYAEVRYSATGAKILEVGVIYSTAIGRLNAGAFDTHREGNNTPEFGIVNGLPSVSGTFGADLTGLNPATQYYAVPYLKLDKASGDFYKGYFVPTGGHKDFKTLAVEDSVNAPALVSACAVTDTTYTTARLSATVTSIGRPAFTDRGFCYGTERNPVMGGSNNECVRSTGTSTTFAENITGLSENTTYYARAYIVNESHGIRYGAETSFKTKRTVGVVGFTFTDERDGQVYRAVEIEGMVWMAENLNYVMGSSWCYDDDRMNCEKYGRLYSWDAAMEACPTGWHLPMRVEWADLIDTIGGASVAGGKLKADAGWNSGNGVDEFGFSALPSGSGGCYYYDCRFGGIGESGNWWSATENVNNICADCVYNRGMSSSNVMSESGSNSKVSGFAIRCVRDDGNSGTSPAAVSAVAVSDVSYFTAKVSASVNLSGNPEFTEWGVCYGTERNPSRVGNNSACVKSERTDMAFSVQVGGKDNTTYYVRAYIVNESFGTRYGAETSFKTMNFGYIKFTDERDGKVYKAVEIGGKIWMAENLNYDTDSSWCYGNDTFNCVKYGKLYAWNAALSACPVGWHLPSRAEWNNLVQIAGGFNNASVKLKSTTGWNYSGINYSGTDDFGFSALPGGGRYYYGGFTHIDTYGHWWSATKYENGELDAYYRFMYYNEGVYEHNERKVSGFSVRCTQDD